MEKDLLILSHLAGTLSSQEQEAFNRLLQTDAAFKAQVEQSAEIWNLSKNTAPQEIDIDLNVSWKAFEQLKTNSADLAPVRKMPIWRSNVLIRVAAVALIVLAGVIIFNESRRDTFLAGETFNAEANHEMLLSMTDGSEAYLAGNSQLEVDDDYNRKSRTTRLSGTAFFVVKPDRDKVFEVVTSHLKTIVKGTTFLVRTDDHSTTVGVQTGVVEVQIGPKIETLRAGEQVTVLAPSGVIKRSALENQEVENLKLSTKLFQNAMLHTILKQVQLLYGFQIEADTALLNQRFTVDFNNIKKDQVLNLIATLTQTTIQHNGEIYVLKQ